MTLKAKTITIFLLAFIFAFIALGYYMDRQIFSVFYRLEDKHFTKVGHQIVNSIENRINYYEAFLRDWGHWDDTYRFVQDLNAEYKASNLSGDVLEDIGLTCILYFDTDMQPRYSYYSEDMAHQTERLTADIQANAEQMKAIATNGQTDFFIKPSQTEDVFLGVITDIVNSEGTKPSVGYMAMAVIFDKSLTDTFSEITSYPMMMNDSLPEGAGTAQMIKPDISLLTKYLNDKKVRQDIVFYDISKQPLLSISLEQERAFNEHMRSILNNSIFVIALSGAITLFIVIYILDRVVLSDIRRKISRFKEIESSNDLSMRLEQTGTVEMQQLASAANAALDRIESLNSEIIRMSNLDSLTQIANRKFFDESYRTQHKSSVRNKTDISILMIDIDHFKNYNDEFGHLKGDKCLKDVAALISKAVSRPVDMVARYGGEEFIVMLPETSLTGAEHIAEKIRASVESAGIPQAQATGLDIVTVSIGAASESPSESSSEIELIAKADRALYQAKHNGRNRVVTQTP